MGESISTLAKTDDTKVVRGAGGSASDIFYHLPWFGMQSGKPSDTVIIFDWDDTLLCSSAINLQQWTSSQLLQLETAVDTILSASMGLGETLIVTNGNKTWVQESCRRFFPKLMPFLSRLRVMSARHEYETRWPGDPFAWKKAAFKEILSDRQERSCPSGVGVNLVVLGDSLAEIQAAQTATATIRGESVVKTLKFKEMPSVSELLGQIRATTQALSDIVHEENSSCKALVPRNLPPHLNHLTSWASGWRVTEHRIGCPVDTRSNSPLTLPMHLRAADTGGVMDAHDSVTMAGG